MQLYSSSRTSVSGMKKGQFEVNVSCHQVLVLSPLLFTVVTMRRLSLHMNRKLYTSCVRSTMLHSSKTSVIKDNDIKKLEHTEKKHAKVDV